MWVTVDSMVVAAKDQISADLQGETIVLGLGKSVYYGVDGVGTRIWGLLSEPRRVSWIRDVISSEFEVDPETCQRDLLAFLGELEAEGLVVAGDEPRS